jgi:hypothetical protein
MYGEDTNQKYQPTEYVSSGVYDVNKLVAWDSRKAALALYSAN